MANSDPPSPESELLLQAFTTFSEASLQLEKAYADLQEHTAELDSELQDTNIKLRNALVEEEKHRLELRGILDSLTTGILVIDLEGIVREVNPCAVKLLGVEEKQCHYSELDLPEPVKAFVYNCLESTMPRVPRSSVSIARDGETLDLELSFTLVRPRGGGIMSVLVLLNDMTLVNRLQNQSRRNVRLAAMGEMAAELAHEIRNPLGSIKLFASLLEGDLAEDEGKARLANQISHGVGILESIVSNILAFSANVTPRRAVITIQELIEQSLPLFELERQRKEIQLDVVTPEAPLRIMADDHLLKQVLLNLCNNAIKAMDQGGKLEILAKPRDNYLELVIQDNGHGIPTDALPKIFDPFFTTFKGGTGLGLSVVNQIIEKHDGAVSIKSEVGVGTSVILSIPRIEE